MVPITSRPGGNWNPSARGTHSLRRMAMRRTAGWRRLRRILCAGAAGTLPALLAVSCGGGQGSTPQGTASAFLDAWGSQNWTAMRQLTAAPPGDFTSVNKVAFTGLHVTNAAFSQGTVQVTG